MGNVNLPTPVAVAGASICVLGGYLLGAVAGPDTPSRTTATVTSFDPDTLRLCLSGESIDEQEGATEQGRLCGTWRRTPGSSTPDEGDRFRFVSIVVERPDDPESAAEQQTTLIYGDVVR